MNMYVILLTTKFLIIITLDFKKINLFKHQISIFKINYFHMIERMKFLLIYFPERLKDKIITFMGPRLDATILDVLF